MGAGENCKKSGVLVIAIYAHIEAYPPSLNALYHLAPLFDKVYIIVRNVLISNWVYPENVEIIKSGKYVPAEMVGKISIFGKLKGYIAFGKTLYRTIDQKKPSMVVLYDMIAFSLFNIFSAKTVLTRNIPIWYHNHDVAIESEVGKFSLMRLLKKLELKYFKRTTFFSLPNEVRLKFFPVNQLKHKPVVLPNYPSKFFFGRWRASLPDQPILKLIFQGHISRGNSIENVIEILPFEVNGKRLELHLAGPIDPDYQNSLVLLAKEKNVSRQLYFYGRVPYAALPELTASCHIGLAFYGIHNTMVRTMSTASNKIFEYASVGLPVIINKRSDMEGEFSLYPWIKFTHPDIGSFLRVLDEITSGYSGYSNKARCDFENNLNFEKIISPFLSTIQDKLKGVA